MRGPVGGGCKGVSKEFTDDDCTARAKGNVVGALTARAGMKDRVGRAPPDEAMKRNTEKKGKE